jgi:hypothetical protein
MYRYIFVIYYYSSSQLGDEFPDVILFYYSILRKMDMHETMMVVRHELLNQEEHIRNVEHQTFHTCLGITFNYLHSLLSQWYPCRILKDRETGH